MWESTVVGQLFLWLLAVLFPLAFLVMTVISAHMSASGSCGRRAALSSAATKSRGAGISRYRRCSHRGPIFITTSLSICRHVTWAPVLGEHHLVVSLMAMTSLDWTIHKWTASCRPSYLQLVYNVVLTTQRPIMHSSLSHRTSESESVLPGNRRLLIPD